MQLQKRSEIRWWEAGNNTKLLDITKLKSSFQKIYKMFKEFTKTKYKLIERLEKEENRGTKT